MVVESVDHFRGNEVADGEFLVGLSWPDQIEHYHCITGNPQSLFVGPA